MQRVFFCCLIALALEPIGAQEVFVAPSQRTIIAAAEHSNSDDAYHMLYLSNNSTVPIVVFGIALTSCENVKQSCGTRRTNIRIGAGRRVNVGRVQPRDTERGFGYRWNFSYHADSSDAKAMAILREHGIELDPGAAARRVAAEATAPVAAEAPTTVATEMPVSATEMPVSQAAVMPDTAARLIKFRSSSAPPRPASRTLRFKLGWGSILGSTMVPDKPIQVTGSCVDPAATEKLEKDQAIEKTPWRPARWYPGFARTKMPPAMRDSLLRSGATTIHPVEVLVRFLADTSGAVIPESVTILESPNGELSASVCKSLFSEDVEPAKNREGKTLATWVQTPVQVVPF